MLNFIIHNLICNKNKCIILPKSATINQEVIFVDFRTDMAVERRDIYRKANNIEDEIDGIECEEEKVDDIKITRVSITNDEGANALKKPIGNYITIDVKKINNISVEKEDKIVEVISKELANIVDKHIKKDEEVMIVGLGNLHSTPDSLGSRVVNEVEITRHIKLYLPQYIDESTRAISAISPGVLGTTGIESAEIIRGIVDKIKPKMIIVIDSLCSKNVSRINKSIKISDTGIVTGGGVGNNREELSKNTLGIPVIALGVPTVVEMASITNDCLDLFIEDLQKKAESNKVLNKLKDEDNYEKIKEALIPNDYNFIVTPKEIDDLIESMKDVISRGINDAL